MTTSRSSQLPTITISGGTVSRPRLPQAAVITVLQQNTPTRLSQVVVISVVANNRAYTTLNPIIGLGCWTPCGWLMQNRSLLQ